MHVTKRQKTDADGLTRIKKMKRDKRFNLFIDTPIPFQTMKRYRFSFFFFVRDIESYSGRAWHKTGLVFLEGLTIGGGGGQSERGQVSFKRINGRMWAGRCSGSGLKTPIRDFPIQQFSSPINFNATTGLPTGTRRMHKNFIERHRSPFQD